MNVAALRKVKLSRIIPEEIRDSLLCFTFVNSAVLNEAPDIATCNANGYLYEVKSKRILRSLNLEDKAASVCCCYAIEKNKIVIFYTVATRSNRLLVIRQTNNRLKVVRNYRDIKDFKLCDFTSLGYPQLKITFLNKSGCTKNFPVKAHTYYNITYNDSETTLVNSLTEELEDLNKFIDVLSEEYNHLKKICSFNMPNIHKISVGSTNFSVTLDNVTENQLKVFGKWIKVFGSCLVLGIHLRNVGHEIIDDLDVIINHKKITDCTLRFFQTSDVSRYLFSTHLFDNFVKPHEDIYAVCSFEVPEFYTESEITLVCYVTSKDMKNCFLKETFVINVSDIALQTTLDLEEKYTVEVLLSVLTIKQETHLKIETEDLEDGVLESLLMERLGFKLIKHVKDKLFYCTSTYLKEVFVALQHISKNPSMWKMSMYTSQQQQIYFIVNALYDLLPENSAVLCDENTC